MPSLDAPEPLRFTYYAQRVKGVWYGHWYDPETHRLIMKEYPDLDENGESEALKRTRFEIVKRYGVDRIIHEGGNDAES